VFVRQRELHSRPQLVCRSEHWGCCWQSYHWSAESLDLIQARVLNSSVFPSPLDPLHHEFVVHSRAVANDGVV
jgi:hypothetical protein